MSGFDTLGLMPRLVRAAEQLGYATPTPVQAAVIPAVLAGRDVLACARTGSGKTAAYGFPLLQQIVATATATGAGARRGVRRGVHTLVLVPTRELAAQVDDTLRGLRRYLAEPVKVAVLYGGVSINPQLMGLRGGAELVIATPGRLLDVLAHNGLDLSAVQCLVFDEADRLLEGAFADELGRVLQRLPARRQQVLVSATFPAAVQRLAGSLLRDPLQVDVTADEVRPEGAPPQPSAEASIAEALVAEAPVAVAPVAKAGDALSPPSARIEQRAIEVDAERRTALLRHLIAEGAWSRVLVFVATRHACEHVAEKLRRGGVKASAFHGDASQGARMRALAEFKSGALQVLVCTDLGARGIDIAQLPVVVNYDLPRSAVDHLHRIGRTGRAGASGLAVSFIGAADEAHFRLIEKRQGQRLARERVDGFAPADRAALADLPDRAEGPDEETHAPTGLDPNGGVKGRRPSKKDKLRAAAAAAARTAPPQGGEGGGKS